MASRLDPASGRGDPTNHETIQETETSMANLEIDTCINMDKTEETLSKMLHTKWDQVYKVSADGKTYTYPPLLAGTPVDKIAESSLYWDKNWSSLDQYLAAEAEELKKQAECLQILQASPSDPVYKRKAKEHQDNMSKHHKVREIFGPDSPYHPHQLINKKHLPIKGLCEQEYMYKLACKISDLKILQNKGLLAMDPWDCLRWRILEKAASLQKAPWDRIRNIKTIILHIADDDRQNGYDDPVLRSAVIRSAQLSGRENSYGPKHKKTSTTA